MGGWYAFLSVVAIFLALFLGISFHRCKKRLEPTNDALDMVKGANLDIECI